MSSFTYNETSYYGSDPAVWARCDGGRGPSVCRDGIWIEFADGSCFCTFICTPAGAACTTDGSGICERLEAGQSLVCVYRPWNLCPIP
ncbi:MAG TPA: hypothetical protein VGQ83_04100 [Polyangia bacterium]